MIAARLHLSRLACTLVVLLMGTTIAAEPESVKLLRPDSLAGWDQDDARTAPWTIRDGRLTASAESGILASQLHFADFTLHLRWSTPQGSAWKVQLPERGSKSTLELILREGAGCGQIRQGKSLLAPGADVAALRDAPHTATIRIARGELSVEVDRRVLSKIALPRVASRGLQLAVEGKQAWLEDLRLEEPKGEALFNGKDLDAWTCPGNSKAWVVENGELVLHPGGGNYLRTKKQYGNFTLSLQYKMQKRGNSGIGIRTPPAGWPSGDGMEVQMEDTPYSKPIDKHATMAIYGNVPPLARTDRSEQWNRVVLKADGRMISAWMNGELVQHCNTADHPELKHRNLSGWIGLQDHGAALQVRDLFLLEGPPEPSPETRPLPQTLRGSAAVLDRLMNTDRILSPDGIRSGSTTARAAGGKTQVLARFVGPGALVRIARNGGEGRLAFSFDDEAAPRLRCSATALAKAVPVLCDDAEPVTTYLGYRQSLTVALEGGKAGQYQFDYVTFPTPDGVRSYTATDPGTPHGWLSALVYRQDQHGWGTLREYDPYPRATAPRASIAPGAHGPTVAVSGSGVVQWLKLQAAKAVLDSTDLWLEVTVDKETQPAIAAPVRFWFPGLAGKGNWPNFVVLDRGGMTNRLAMPFGKGIAISLVNRGKQAVADVGLIVSYAPIATAQEQSAAGFRLRGVFEPRATAQAASLRLNGRGRWVGLVCDEPGRAPASIRSLTVDGHAVDGWSDLPAALWLGRGGAFRGVLAGREGDLWWRWLLPNPVDFAASLELLPRDGEHGGRLALYYGAK